MDANINEPKKQYCNMDTLNLSTFPYYKNKHIFFNSVTSNSFQNDKKKHIVLYGVTQRRLPITRAIEKMLLYSKCVLKILPKK